MFGLFSAKPPVSPWEKAWTEDKLLWMAEELGWERLLETETLLPGDERIPDVSNYDTAAELLEFVASWMKLETSNVRLQVHSDVVTPESMGQYADQGNATVIQVHERQFTQPDELVAVFAWQLSADLITSGRMKNAKLSDREWTVDLLPVFLGTGVFAANHVLRKPKEHADHFGWWGVRQRGYLPGRVFGYALALRATLQMDTNREWVNVLRQDAEVAANDSAKYLAKTNDTICCREASNLPRRRVAVDVLIEELSKGSPSRKVSAMWELARRSDAGNTDGEQQIGDLLLNVIRDKQPEVRAVAAATLPLFNLGQHAAQELCDALKDPSEDVRTSAASALGAFSGVDDDTVVHDLTDALNDDARLVVFNAAHALVQYGQAAEVATQTLLKRLRQTLIDCRDGDAQSLLVAIDCICTDTAAVIDDFFVESDREYRDMAIELLEDLKDEQPDTVS